MTKDLEPKFSSSPVTQAVTAASRTPRSTGPFALTAHRVLLLVSDQTLGETTRRLARRAGLTVTTCFNFSDFWQLVMSRRHELAGLVLDQQFVPSVVRSTAYRRLGDLPVVILTRAPGSPVASPFSNATQLAINPASNSAREIVETLIDRHLSREARLAH